MQNMAEITVNNKLAIPDRRFLNQNTRSCICFSDEASHRFYLRIKIPSGSPAHLPCKFPMSPMVGSNPPFMIVTSQAPRLVFTRPAH